MHVRRKLLFVAAVLCAQGGPAGAFAAPPTDADIDRAIRTYRQVFANGAANHEDVLKATNEAMAGLDVSQMTGVQLAKLMDQASLISDSGNLEPAMKRMRELLPDRGADGAAAAVRLLGERVRAEKDRAGKLALLRETIAHPGLDAAAKAGGADLLFGLLGAESGDMAGELWPELIGLERLLTPELAPRLAPWYTEYYSLVSAGADAGGEKSAERTKEVERLRQKLVSLSRGCLDTVDQSKREYVETAAAYLDGAYMRGQLVGHKAPALDVLWSSDPSIKSLDSLKGRVVVLDFWATWCGPCVGSFPQVRELQERYKDYPVSIVGVSSPQGSVVGLGGKIVPCKGDPAKEFELMRQYMTEKNITWPLVFSKQPPSNPDYGIRGIPHVVIIDPAGVVRYRGLHPKDATAKKAAKIDGLLREFGLKAPPAVAADDAPKGDTGHGAG